MKQQERTQEKRVRNTESIEAAKVTFKAVVLGPIVAIVFAAVIYMVWWMLSKAFYFIHEWMTVFAIPWCEEAWPYLLGIWIFILITSIGFCFLKFNKKEGIEEEDLEEDIEEEDIEEIVEGSTEPKMVRRVVEYFSGEDIFSNSEDDSTNQ